MKKQTIAAALAAALVGSAFLGTGMQTEGTTVGAGWNRLVVSGGQ